MKIAVVGCAHGELDKIYEAVRYVEESDNIRVDLVICCGDFQAVRNYFDLNCMAVPPAYRQLNTFYKYYSGECRAPYLTLFVGGNHEASNYLSELPYGGWVAPGIYYLGYANVLRIGDTRVAGLSGIFKGQHYFQGHFECPPYNEDTKRSAYHVRQLDVFRLKQLKSNGLDVFISHDWPRGIHNFGDADRLFRVKPFFRDEATQGTLGSPPSEDLLFALKPKYWFAAHMHVKFPALIEHEGGTQTRYLALDKCLPRREYMQILDIGGETADRLSPSDLKYDLEWLTVLKSTNHLCSTSNRVQYMPGPTPGSSIRFNFTPTDDELDEVMALFENNLAVPLNFRMTAAPLFELGNYREAGGQQKYYVNPQTTEFCRKLAITNTNELLAKLRPQVVDLPYYIQSEKVSGQVAAEACASGFDTSSVAPEDEATENPDEIQLEEEGEAESSSPIETIASDQQKTLSSEAAVLLSEKRSYAETTADRSSEDRGKSDLIVSGGNSGAPEKEADSNAMKKFKRRNADMYAPNEDST